MKRKVEHESYAKGRDGHRYSGLWSMGPHRLNIEIRHNSYAENCYAKVSVWNDEWKTVATIMPELMHVRKCSVLGPTSAAPGEHNINCHKDAYFNGDIEALLEMAEFVLSPVDTLDR
jgi:hypothetical protein